MMWVLCDNLKGFFTSRPPLTLFLLCLGGFTITLLTLAYQVKSGTFRNPDEKDWNDFLNGFKKVQFCVIHDLDTDANTTGSNLPMAHRGYKDVLPEVNSDLLNPSSNGPITDTVTKHPNEIVTLSIPLWIEVKPTEDFLTVPHNVTHLSTRMTGKQIGFQGDDPDFDFNLTFTLPYQWNRSLCDESRGCAVVKIWTCVNFQAPAKLFPKSRFPDGGHCEMGNITGGVENYFNMVSKERSPDNPGQRLCDKAGMTVTHEEDSSLFIMLTKQDRSVINLHLMHTNYFLFVMVITLFCYALVRGKLTPQKPKPVHYTEVPTDV